MKRRLKLHLFIVLLLGLLLIKLAGRPPAATLEAQGPSQQTVYLEKFGTDIIPQFNHFFTHSFSHATAWDLTSASPYVPAPPGLATWNFIGIRKIRSRFPCPGGIMWARPVSGATRIRRKMGCQPDEAG